MVQKKKSVKKTAKVRKSATKVKQGLTKKPKGSAKSQVSVKKSKVAPKSLQAKKVKGKSELPKFSGSTKSSSSSSKPKSSKSNYDMYYLIGAIAVVLAVLLFAFNQTTPVDSAKKLDEMSAAIETRANFTTEGKGNNPGAKVDLIIYSDYYCPFCGREHESIKQVMTNYPTEVNVVFKHFPGHKGSLEAALAAECARDQRLFWQYSDLLFKKGTYTTNSELKSMAKSIGMNMDEFSYCFDNQVKYGIIQNDVNEGKLGQVTGTPTSFVNSIELRGMRSYAVLKSHIDSELSK